MTYKIIIFIIVPENIKKNTIIFKSNKIIHETHKIYTNPVTHISKPT